MMYSCNDGLVSFCDIISALVYLYTSLEIINKWYCCISCQFERWDIESIISMTFIKCPVDANRGVRGQKLYQRYSFIVVVATAAGFTCRMHEKKAIRSLF